MKWDNWDAWVFVGIFGLVVTSCVGSPEPHNPMTRPAPDKAKVTVVEPAKCHCGDHKDTTQDNPYLTDEEKKILKKVDSDLEKLEPKLEVEKEKKVY